MNNINDKTEENLNNGKLKKKEIQESINEQNTAKSNLLLTKFLVDGNYILTENIEEINSLSSYIKYIINLNQTKNLYLTFEYISFINVLIKNKNKLNSIRVILNLIEPYKLKELNDIIISDNKSIYKIENIIIDNINFDIEDIYNNYLNYIKDIKYSNIINYSNIIFSSNKEKNYLIDLLNFNPYLNTIDNNDLTNNEIETQKSYFYYITDYKNLNPNIFRLVNCLISDNSYIISNCNILNIVLSNDILFNNVIYKKCFINYSESQINHSYIFKSNLNLQIKFVIYFNKNDKSYTIKMIPKQYTPPNLIEDDEKFKLYSVFFNEKDKNTQLNSDLQSNYINNLNIDTNISLIHNILLNNIYIDITSYKYYLVHNKQIHIETEMSFNFNNVKKYLYDNINNVYTQKIIKTFYRSFNINFDLTNSYKIKFKQNDLLYYNKFNIIDFTNKLNQFSNNYITKFTLNDKSCYKKNKKFFIHDLLRIN